ncbi:MAG: CHRD domain-containing protein [Flavobacteriaceae bacterium]|nr:CHRD domain-containing protein [Flavobacteriaceae bacterium]
MKYFKRFIFILTFLTILISCSNDEDPIPDPNITFEATLNGAQSVPANNATTTGTALLTFNNDTKVFTITVTHNIASPTNGHIHKAAVGENGGPVFAFTNFTSPINFTSNALDATQEADLKAGLYYVNIHTQDFPGGEIRGQLINN